MNRLHIALIAGFALCMPIAYAQNQSSQSDTQHMQSKDQGQGVKHGSNEGGSDRTPTAGQPTGAPGTGDASAQSDKQGTDGKTTPTKRPKGAESSSKSENSPK